VLCPGCEHPDSRVVDSRLSRGGRAIRRRRECARCGRRFTTYEQLEEEPLAVRKRDASSEPFERAKLLRSVQIACAKRPVSRAEVEDLVDEVQASLEASDDREVDSLRIGEMVMGRLRRLDQVAFVRFASVYRNFQDTTEFMEEIRELVRRAGYDAAGQVDMFSAEEGDDES
jgi:transcriptional repressor NrdR